MIQALAFTLICYGVANVPTVDTATTTLTDGRNTLRGTTSSYGRERTGDRMWVKVDGGTVSIRGPGALQPPISGSGRDGWRDLTDVTISDNEIRGRFSFNWLNRPTVVIDRMTGEIRITESNVLIGRSSFVGDCERAEMDTPRF